MKENASTERGGYSACSCSHGAFSPCSGWHRARISANDTAATETLSFLRALRYEPLMKSTRTALHSIAILAFGLSIGGCASKREVAAPVAATLVPAGSTRASAGTAIVYVYRPKKRLGWSSPFSIRD